MDEKIPIAKIELIGQLFSDTCRLNEAALCASVSVGIAMFPNHGMTFTQLYKNADDALYAAKRRGKNGYALLNDAGEYIYSNFSASESSEVTE